MKKISALALLLFTSFSFSLAQETAPKREFRAVWIASVANIDWPSQKGLSSVVQQEEFRYILDEHQKNGMNAVIVQVRPTADALYQSSLEPWSAWLTGKQGTEPNPPYDPLQFQIAEAHQRGMEFHAWFNPYRAQFDSTSVLATDHITRKKPQWFLKYEGKLLFNPGLPEVRAYITGVIMDVVRRYDIDGVHFDDYFYPYPVANKPFPDDSTFIKYRAGFSNKNDWRRNNIDLLIKMVSDSIAQAKPQVKFGISPFGVWKNKAEDPAGSDTKAGAPTFSALYADTRKWLQNGWIDYILPQIYWHIGHPAANYATLVDWWSKNSFNRHLYIGIGAYKINRDATYKQWSDPLETGRQIRINRKTPQVSGSVYFSSKSVMANPKGVQDTLRQQYYRHPALVPVMPWKKSALPVAPTHPTAQNAGSGVALQWQEGAGASANRYYVIYRFENKTAININNPQNIIAQVFATNANGSYLDKTARLNQQYYYVITALNAVQAESSPSAPATYEPIGKTRKKFLGIF